MLVLSISHDRAYTQIDLYTTDEKLGKTFVSRVELKTSRKTDYITEDYVTKLALGIYNAYQDSLKSPILVDKDTMALKGGQIMRIRGVESK